MQIVIEIPEEYRKIFETEKCKSKFDSLASNEFGYVLRKAFENGTLLPKNHGRLIDEQQIIDRFKPVEKFEYWRIGLDGLVSVLSDAPTIIEGSEECVLDKIRAEIEARLYDVVSDYTDGYRTAIQGVLYIIDKYKAESEDKE